jgi:hypothetical protein
MPHYSLHEVMTPAGRSTTMPTGTFSSPEVVAFSALPHLLPFIIPKENVHYLAVLVSGHHGLVVMFGDGADVDSEQRSPQQQNQRRGLFQGG